MSKKLPFTFEYTKQMSESFNDEFKSSGKCSVQNPDFYGKWNTVKLGTPEYDVAFSKKRNKK
jgi:hypothetical protein